MVEFKTHVDRYIPTFPNLWKSKVFSSGDAIYNLDLHLFNQVIFIFSLLKEITAFINTQRTKENNLNSFENYLIIHFHYKNKITAIAKTNIVSLKFKYLRF